MVLSHYFLIYSKKSYIFKWALLYLLMVLYFYSLTLKGLLCMM